MTDKHLVKQITRDLKGHLISLFVAPWFPGRVKRFLPETIRIWHIIFLVIFLALIDTEALILKWGTEKLIWGPTGLFLIKCLKLTLNAYLIYIILLKIRPGINPVRSLCYFLIASLPLVLFNLPYIPSPHVILVFNLYDLFIITWHCVILCVILNRELSLSYRNGFFIGLLGYLAHLLTLSPFLGFDL